jgi:hypothetical protein
VEAIAMISTTQAHRTDHPHVSCHLGMHDWMKVRDDEGRAHFVCRHCDHMKAASEPWWGFASEAGTGFH